ncbi:hypothetical protein EVAR_99135_1 [Eumeta japonica]|uniref:Uncharacterized protein n=1 Tax=Eumeta variegata TaxID=151549 RepID=A0A4C1STH1_EUMVA|nr:hypothetical protein EVAR_99135_1 [Eumeta japonica]
MSITIANSRRPFITHTMRVRRTRPLRNTSLLRPDDSAGNGCSDDVPMSVVSRRWVPQHRRSTHQQKNVDSHIHQSVTSIKTSDAFPTTSRDMQIRTK